MANSLRAKITKLRHDRKITEEEYQALIKKLDGHDTEMILKLKKEVISEAKNLVKARLVDTLGLENAVKYGNKTSKQQENSYATVMKYEIADCIDDLLDDLEKMKEDENDRSI